MKKIILSMALLISGFLMQCVLVSSANSTPALTSNWLTGFNGTISADGQTSTYPYQVGIFNENTADVPRFRIVEEKNGSTVRDISYDNRKPTGSLNTSLYPEFTGPNNWIYKMPSEYGNWYGRWTNCAANLTFCLKVLFVPDVEKINNPTTGIGAGEVFTSTFNYDLFRNLRVRAWVDSYNGPNAELRHTASLTVTISRPINVSIAPREHYVEEFVHNLILGGFTVAANSAPATDLRYRWMESGRNGIQSEPSNKILAGQTTSAIFAFSSSTNPDRVTVTLADSASGQYVVGTPNAATVYKVSETKPGISLSFVEVDGDGNETAIAEGGSIDFGGRFKIKATATPAPITNLTVSISIAQAPSGIIAAGSSTPTSITINRFDTEGLSGVLSAATDGSVNGGTVTATLATNASYKIHPTLRSASLTVNPHPRVKLSIAPKTPYYSTGNPIFIVTANPTPAIDVPFRYVLNNTGSPVFGNTIKVSAGQTTYEFTPVGAPSFADVTVNLAESADNRYERGIQDTAIMYFTTAASPGVSISFVDLGDTNISDGESIAMGDGFKIKATATPTPTNNVQVMISVANPSDLITTDGLSNIPESITISNITGTGLSERIMTRNSGNRGTITVTLLTNPQSSYAINPAFNPTSLKVNGTSSSSGRAQQAEEEDRRHRMASTIQAIQPTMTASSAESTQDAVESQLDLAFSGGGSSFTIGGNSSLTDALAFSGEVANGRTVSLENFISGSSFKLQLFPEEGGSGMASIWGVGNSREVSGAKGDSNLSWDGSMLVGHLGFDVRVDRELVFGLASSFSEAETIYANDSDIYGNGTYHSRNFGMHPYVGWKSLDGNAEVRSSVGYGTGEIQVTQDGHAPEIASTSLAMLAVSGWQNLYSADETALGGRGQISLKANSWATQQFVHENHSLIDNMQFAASHVLLAAEASHNWKLFSSSTVKPGFLLGFERNGGDQQTELGAVVGGKISYGNPFGLTVSGVVSGPLSGDVRDWGLRGLVAYDWRSDGLGLVMEIESAWGYSGHNDKLFSNDATILYADTAQQNSGSKHSVEIGYGMRFFDDAAMLVPFSGIEMTDGKVDEFGFGSRLTPGSDISIELNWTHIAESYGANRGLNLSGDFKW